MQKTARYPCARAALAALALCCLGGAAGAGTAAARWAREAARVTITRDDHGIAHVRGRTDADAVFGAAYAQAEDDFSRVEWNYVTALGRTGEALGEGAIWTDLRRRLFIDPEALKADYAQSPAWLRALMDAWADGLNAYLASHPDAHPKVIRRFDPWMALSFTEGSIGGDDERVGPEALRAFYDGAAHSESARDEVAEFEGARRLERHRHRPRAHPRAPRPAADQPAHLLLFPRRAADDERRGAGRLWRQHVGAVLPLPGLQRPRRLDAHLDRRRQRRRVRRDDRAQGRRLRLPLRRRAAPRRRTPDRHPLSRRRRIAGGARLRHLRHPPRPDRPGRRRQVDRRRHAEPAYPAAGAVVAAHQGERLCRLHQGGFAAGERQQRHPVRRRQGRDRLSHAAVRAPPRRPVRLPGAGRRRRSGDRLEGPARPRRTAARGEPAERLGDEHQRRPVVGGRAEQPEAGRLPALHGHLRPELARRARPAVADRQLRLDAGRAARRRLRSGVCRHSTRCCRRCSPPSTRCRSAIR